MNSYEILKNIHRVGHRISGVVLRHEKFEHNGLVIYQVEVKTSSKYKSILAYNSWEYDLPLTENLIPKRGQTVEMVIKNFVDNTLYLSVNPFDLDEARIKWHEDFYKAIETLKEGTIIKGKIRTVTQFGIFVDLLNYQFIGLIDIGHSSFNQGVKLPSDFSSWANKGDDIQCVVSYFRFGETQIGLGWSPD